MRNRSHSCDGLVTEACGRPGCVRAAARHGWVERRRRGRRARQLVLLADIGRDSTQSFEGIEENVWQAADSGSRYDMV